LALSYGLGTGQAPKLLPSIGVLRDVPDLPRPVSEVVQHSRPLLVFGRVRQTIVYVPLHGEATVRAVPGKEARQVLIFGPEFGTATFSQGLELEVLRIETVDGESLEDVIALASCQLPGMDGS